MQYKQVSTIIRLFSVLVLFISKSSFPAQTPAAKTSVPALRQGIHVQLPVTKNAIAMPDADKEDALVVAVLRDGEVYSDANVTTPAALSESLRDIKTFYLKADANTSYANVEKVLDAVYRAGIRKFSVLTSQPTPHTETMIPPEGLEVMIGSSLSAEATVVRVLDSGHKTATFKINNKNVSRDHLQALLNQVLQNQSQKVVLIEAQSTVSFAVVVDVADVVRSTRATVVLVQKPQ